MKKKILGLSILSLGVVALTNVPMANAASDTIYVSADGVSTNAGTKESPLDFFTAQLNALPGQTILLKEGTYNYDTRINVNGSGTAKSMITVKPEVVGSKVVFDFSAMEFNGNNRGIQLNGNYWHFYGIEITGAGDNGMYVAGSNNIIEYCQFYRNSDTGLQLGRGSGSYSNINLWPSNNLIKNCTSYENYDKETLGENADGFGAKLTIGYGNVFDGCIAYRNSDDGWDLYAKEDSGNIGTVTLLNCVSFENGFIATPYETNTGALTYNTVNGDGIGFKLGGGVMEGDVIIDNCVAFNNKLHGFSDNSNPGFINIKNSTAVNNCIGLNEDGTVAGRGVVGSENKSNNFDMARDTNSYNSYYGLVSFTNNQENFTDEGNNSYNNDKFRGSVAYSVFQTSYDKENKQEVYMACGAFQEASAYNSDLLPLLTEEYTGISEASFASVASINAIGDKIGQIHTLLRNSDGSVNLGDTLKIVDNNLLTFANGKPIGANLSKASYEEYNHYSTGDISGDKSNDELLVLNAYDALELATEKEAVYQNFDIPCYLNNCEVSWKSSNEDILKIDTNEEISLSSSVYVKALVFSPEHDTKVTLTATISRGEAKVEKTFEVLIKARNIVLGSLISSDGVDTYIVKRYYSFMEPTITVTDASSTDNSELNKDLYTLTKKYEWADSKGGTYVEVSGIYTSVPGVFKVTTTATLNSDTTKSASYVYYIFIGKDECEIDFNGGINTFKLNAGGFNISGKLSNITGKIYVAVVGLNDKIFNAQELLAASNLQVSAISKDEISFNFEADNSSDTGYAVYYMISDLAGKNFSNIYSKKVYSTTISTHEEFYNLARGISETDSMTVYNLTNDLDFANYTWVDAESPKAFTGTFNGNGYKISNVTIETEIQKQANIFYKVENGNVMNIVFENISIINNHSSAKLVGIIGAMNGGNVSNIDIKNITSIATSGSSTCVGGLIGQMIGGINNVDHITLINDENQQMYAGNKYVGGIVGNVQMDTGIDSVEVNVSYCVVKADIGNGKDSGGCIAGIVGRIKNDKISYSLNVNNCYYKGTIATGGNYNAGIVGSIESGTAPYNISNNFADVVFIYCKEGNLVLDAKEVNTEVEYQAYAHKNCNPICGRATNLTNDMYGTKNAGSWQEYYSSTIGSMSIYFLYGKDFVPKKGFFKSFCDWDVENDWLIDDDGNVSLR